MQPYDPNQNMNAMMRNAGNRSRSLPNIGQTPAVQAANVVLGQSPTTASPPAPMTPAPSPAPTPTAPGMTSSPLAAPPVQDSTFTLHPPGSPSDPTHYNYEPQADGSWRVYPPGVNAPPHTIQASMPRAASTADYRRMRQAFMQQSGQPAAPMMPIPGQTPGPTY